MAITTKAYGLFFSSLANKEGDFNSDTIKVAQHTSSYTPNQDTHQYWDVSATNQCSGTGYTAGGASVTGSFSYDGASNTFTLDLTDITSAWTGNAVTNCRYLLIYDSTPSSNKPLIAYVDLGEDSQVLSVTWHVNGVVTVTVA
jgi:hypothetical protein